MESEVDITAQRRMIFAASFLPQDIPNYWDIVAEFANQSNPGESRITKESAKVVVENLQVLKPKVFSADLSLKNELINMKYGITGQPIGIPLVSSKKSCLSCDGKLLLRNDRHYLYRIFRNCSCHSVLQILSKLSNRLQTCSALHSGRCQYVLRQGLDDTTIFPVITRNRV